MIPSGIEVFVALAPIDLRYGFDRLAGLVEEQVGRSARSGALFVFYGKRRTALKVLYFDGSGMCLFYKRADRGTFRVPQANTPDATSIEVNDASWKTCSTASTWWTRPRHAVRAEFACTESEKSLDGSGSCVRKAT